jgi:CheY-like chemotaxis protein
MSQVLIIDDHPDSADILGLVLRGAGHDVRTAMDGQAGLTVAAAFHPDTVILDLAMPGMDGYAVARQLRKRFGPDLRLVCWSGFGTEEDRERARAAGFDHFIIKPGEPEEIIRSLGGRV